MTKLSPSSTARVCRPARSEPAFGSLMPMHHTVSPRIAAGASSLLRGRSELEQGRRDDRVPGEVHRPRDALVRHLLEVDERLHRRCVPAAELGRVARDHPAVVEQRRLPVARPLRDQRAVAGRAHIAGEVAPHPRLGRRVLIEERDELGAERLFRFSPREVHGRALLALDLGHERRHAGVDVADERDAGVVDRLHGPDLRRRSPR